MPATYAKGVTRCHLDARGDVFNLHFQVMNTRNQEQMEPTINGTNNKNCVCMCVCVYSIFRAGDWAVTSLCDVDVVLNWSGRKYLFM